MLAVLAVFVAGLMVGRTPEYFCGKQITAREMKLVSRCMLTTPALVAGRHGDRHGPVQRPVALILNPGPHGFSEVLYAFTSAANNNGSAFGGLSGEHAVLQHRRSVLCMLLGRFGPDGRWCSPSAGGPGPAASPSPATSGTLPTHRALFVTMLRRASS